MSKDNYYHFPQEVWDKKTCEEKARFAPKDVWGNKPPKGLINHISSHSTEYGQTKEYNGGCIHDNQWYQGEVNPLPAIHEDYEFFFLDNWGMAIRRKTARSSSK